MKRIELITTQQVRISYEIAGLGDRILAFFVDICVLGGLMFAEAFTLGILGANDDWIYLLVILSTFIFYTLISEILMGGQTLGKKALGLKVIQVHGRHPLYGRYDPLPAERMRPLRQHGIPRPHGPA